MEKVSAGRVEPDGEEDFEEEAVDPRIEIELNNLNNAGQEINVLEKELDEARSVFRQRLTDAARNLKSLSNNLGSTIDKARPYFEAVNQAKEAQQQCHQAAVTFERANELHQEARDLIASAEDKLATKQAVFDSSWQETLNNANVKLLDTKKRKLLTETEHQEACLAYEQLSQRVNKLEKQLKSSINKARPYFEERTQCLAYLEDQKNCVGGLENRYNQAKEQYANSLKALEVISEEIHQKRQIVEGSHVEDSNSTSSRPSSEREGCIGAEAEVETPVSSPSKRRSRGDSWSKSEEKIQKVLTTSRQRKFREGGGRFRSSLVMELDVDIDIDELYSDSTGPTSPKSLPSPPTSPSIKSAAAPIDRRTSEEFEVLDVSALMLDADEELRERQRKRSQARKRLQRKSKESSIVEEDDCAF